MKLFRCTDKQLTNIRGGCGDYGKGVAAASIAADDGGSGFRTGIIHNTPPGFFGFIISHFVVTRGPCD